MKNTDLSKEEIDALCKFTRYYHIDNPHVDKGVAHALHNFAKSLASSVPLDGQIAFTLHMASHFLPSFTFCGLDLENEKNLYDSLTFFEYNPCIKDQSASKDLLIKALNALAYDISHQKRTLSLEEMKLVVSFLTDNLLHDKSFGEELSSSVFEPLVKIVGYPQKLIISEHIFNKEASSIALIASEITKKHHAAAEKAAYELSRRLQTKYATGVDIQPEKPSMFNVELLNTATESFLFYLHQVYPLIEKAKHAALVATRAAALTQGNKLSKETEDDSNLAQNAALNATAYAEASSKIIAFAQTQLTKMLPPNARYYAGLLLEKLPSPPIPQETVNFKELFDRMQHHLDTLEKNRLPTPSPIETTVEAVEVKKKRSRKGKSLETNDLESPFLLTSSQQNRFASFFKTTALLLPFLPIQKEASQNFKKGILFLKQTSSISRIYLDAKEESALKESFKKISTL